MQQGVGVPRPRPATEAHSPRRVANERARVESYLIGIDTSRSKHLRDVYGHGRWSVARWRYWFRWGGGALSGRTGLDSIQRKWYISYTLGTLRSDSKLLPSSLQKYIIWSRIPA